MTRDLERDLIELEEWRKVGASIQCATPDALQRHFDALGALLRGCRVAFIVDEDADGRLHAVEVGRMDLNAAEG